MQFGLAAGSRFVLSGQLSTEERPDKPLTVLGGVDLLRHGWQGDDVMGDRASRGIPASVGVWEAQRNMAADVPARG